MTVEVKERPATTGPNTNTCAKLSFQFCLYWSSHFFYVEVYCLYKDRELAAAKVEIISSYHRLIAARRLPAHHPTRLFNGNGNTQTQTAPTPSHKTKDQTREEGALDKDVKRRRRRKRTDKHVEDHSIGRKDMIVARQARRTPRMNLKWRRRHAHPFGMCSAQPVGLIAALRLPTHHPLRREGEGTAASLRRKKNKEGERGSRAREGEGVEKNTRMSTYLRTLWH
ncbi:hypothetical protein B0H16DRAFT_1834292 [Mycena metata]|uniref:Uncharacterized protein n=1 Tax=Mycena metata TaxID=1033252 RepID=A0AAD7DYK8_9AGAR|nr:hypothetical protein B0H16DRAFT_1834292 [Mycena metata]